MSEKEKEQQQTKPKTQSQELQFEVHSSTTAVQFFLQHNISVLATAYKSNVVFCIGATKEDTKANPKLPPNRLSVFYSSYNHPMAIALSQRSDVQEVWLATKSHLIRMCDAGPEYCDSGPSCGGGGPFTSTLVPRQLHAIGDQDVHGIYTQDINQPLFLSTSFCALCRLDTEKPEQTTNVVWKPPFVSEIQPEDRCHFNGVCFIDGKAKYACCLCEADAHDGWRDHRQNGGVLVDMDTNEIVCRNLSMPHSPVWYKEQIWMLNSGTGHLGVVDIKKGKFEPKKFIPGFLRGLQFVGRYAIIGSSLDRHEKRFQDLELGKTLDEKKTTPSCGIFVIDLANFSIAHKIEFVGTVQEIYDICVVSGRRARTVGVNDNDSTKIFKVVESAVKEE